MDILGKLCGIWNKEFTRKDFLRKCAVAGICVGTSSFAFDLFSKYKAYASIDEKRGMKEALYYEKWGGGTVKCLLCPMGCVLSTGQRGFCRVREPVDGKLYTLVYELVCSLHIDPIEKKPVFHMLPASKALSVATAGCNSRCKFCQNWTISQKPPEETANRVVTARGLVESAKNNGCASIAYTYSEPVVFYEYMLASAELARKAGIKNIMVTGGKINKEPLENAARYIDVANVDLKGFDKKYMREVCAQDLDNILAALTTMRKSGMWIELTNLIVPTLNDNMEDIRRMSAWIRDNLGEDTPLHFSRFWPQYKLRSLYPTPVETLMAAREVALKEGLRYVYTGNIPGMGVENTICPGCGETVIKREGYAVMENNIAGGKCKFCGRNIAGIWT